MRSIARLGLLVVLVTSIAMPGTARAGGAGAHGGHRSANRANFTYRVVDHNVAHNSTAIRVALGLAARTKARAITLQEVCIDQMRTIRDQHPHWTVAWVPENSRQACAKPLTTEHRNVGNVAIWTGGGRGRPQHFTWQTQAAGEQRGMACVVYRRGARIRICSMHLTAGSHSARARLRQASSMRLLTRRWVRQGDLVVVGGDFNARQDSPVLDQVYRRGGHGFFREATAPPHGFDPCRCFFSTLDHGHTKFDYVFFSANRMRPDAPRHLAAFPTPSDHLVVSAWARVSTRPVRHQSRAPHRH